MRLYLQSIIDATPFDNVPLRWQGFDFKRFSSDKTLFDFQILGLKNAIKTLWLYYKEMDGKKQLFYNLYKANGFEEYLDYDLKKKIEGKTAKYLLEYEQSYPVLNNKISFECFINRMSFWMATGSGKTLLIVKLIDILGKLAKEKELPGNDILFLAHRDDLLEQFKNHVEEFNDYCLDMKIRLKSLRDYEIVKRENPLPYSNNEITVFYYRSDLFSDVQKEKFIDYRNYDNEGKWHILLDEAHKGDKEDSKRQILYSILSRNGFLFNYSATFTDPRDYATCAFNFNLSRFTEEGYGKHIYVSKTEISAFRDKTDFSPIEKQKITLKSLILLTYINKYYEIIAQEHKYSYHRPLLLTLVNSVDIKDSDLKMFFNELETIARNELKQDLLRKAKEELAEEFEKNPSYEFEDLSCDINTDLLLKLEYADILKQVFNSGAPGNFEVLNIPGNRSELIFKLRTTEKPFMLIKIGDISGWLKEKLDGYEINESYENESYFNKLNSDDSSINVLMGSRAFYEGWDSNRPNLILFVNIGVGNDAKKFVLQSVGRGVRIEPLKNKRRRLQYLVGSKEVKQQTYIKIKKLIAPIESLFILGTNAENLKQIISTLKEEKQDRDLGSAFIINSEAEKHFLLIPIYKDSEKIFAEEKELQKYPISREDLKLTERYYEYLGDKISLSKYECEVKLLKKAQESFKEEEKCYDISEERSLLDPELILSRVIEYFSVRSKELDKFNKLEDEIVHYKRIRFYDGEKFEQILKKIQQVRNYEQKAEKIESARLDFKKHKDIEKYDGERERIDREYQKETTYEQLKIKYIKNHYYIPLVISENEKVDYINHIINVASEVRFIEELEEYIVTPDNIFSNLDWWMFSKLDQALDEVYIPYYNPKENRVAKFKPDFIFWLQKGKKYVVLFVDPKGTEHTDGYRKIDGYSKIFETKEKRESKSFELDGLSISAKLLLKPRHGIAEVLDNYKKYWFDNFVDFGQKL